MSCPACSESRYGECTNCSWRGYVSRSMFDIFNKHKGGVVCPNCQAVASEVPCPQCYPQPVAASPVFPVVLGVGAQPCPRCSRTATVGTIPCRSCKGLGC